MTVLGPVGVVADDGHGRRGRPTGKTFAVGQGVVAVDGIAEAGAVGVGVAAGVAVRAIAADKAAFCFAVTVPEGKCAPPGQIQVDFGIEVKGIIIVVAQKWVGVLVAQAQADPQSPKLLGIGTTHVVEVVDVVPAAHGGVSAQVGGFRGFAGTGVDDAAQGAVAVFYGAAAFDDLNAFDIVQRNGAEVDIIAAGHARGAYVAAVQIEHDAFGFHAANGNDVAAVAKGRLAFEGDFRIAHQIVCHVVAAVSFYHNGGGAIQLFFFQLAGNRNGIQKKDVLHKVVVRGLRRERRRAEQQGAEQERFFHDASVERCVRLQVNIF